MDQLTYKGQIYGVECNFNALCACADMLGARDFGYLDNMALGRWLQLMTCCINEGERLSGRPHDHKPEEFGTGLAESAGLVSEFISIYNRQMGASPDDLGRLRLPDYWSAMTAYSEQVQADRQHQGDLIRCATMMLINLQLKPKDRFKRVQDFWPMPWDPPSEDPGKAIRDMSDAERQSMYNDFLKRLDG